MPGHSGNPKGRPKSGESFTDVLRSKLDPDLLTEKLIERIRDGDMQAIKYGFDRLDGTPVQRTDQTIRELPKFVGFETEDDSENKEPA